MRSSTSRGLQSIVRLRSGDFKVAAVRWRQAISNAGIDDSLAGLSLSRSGGVIYSPQKRLLSIAATAAGLALALGSVLFEAANTTPIDRAEIAQAKARAPRSLPAAYGQDR